MNRIAMVVCVFLSCLVARVAPARPGTETPPHDDPVAAYYAAQKDAIPAWVTALPWNRTVNITDAQGTNDDERVRAAQTEIVKRGGGVIYFPAGTYTFSDDIRLETGVILRGETPVERNAKSDQYAPRTRFEFPSYRPSMEGEGTPIRTAFKCIRLAEPAKAGHCGIANITINRGHVYFEEGPDHLVGSNRFVFGCLLSNTAAADPTIPNKEYSQQAHQRFTARHRAAIHLFSGENMFVANNRLPKSGDGNFLVKPYTLVRVLNGKGQDFTFKSKKPFRVETLEDGVEFDYDNRPGIYANFGKVGSIGHDLPNGTPETYPQGFRKGIILRDNYIYCSGRCAIAFAGDGVLCSFNTIRYPTGLRRPTTTGLVASDGSATNDNRAMTMRGYRWHVEGNDYEVHSNTACDGHNKINDGEGIMHENHDNSAVRGSKMIGNTGNRYLCLWVMDIDGLLIQSNKVSAGGAAIHVLSGDRPVNNLKILDNELTQGHISVSATSGRNIEIARNRFTGQGQGKISVDDTTWTHDNVNFATEVHKPRQK